MPEINLLQNQLKDTTNLSRHRTQMAVVVFAIILILIVAAGGALYFLTEQTRSQTEELVKENDKIKEEISKRDSTLAGAKTYQAQLSNVELLLKNHLYMSPLLEELSKYTYQGAKFLSFDVTQDIGKIHAEGIAENYEGLGKLMLGLSTSPNFNKVKLLATALSIDPKNPGVNFSIDMQASSNIFSKIISND